MRDLNLDELEMVSGGYVVSTYYGSAYAFDGYGVDASNINLPGRSGGEYSIFIGGGSSSMSYSYSSSQGTFDLHFDPSSQLSAAAAQANFCNTDPFWTSVISSGSFKNNEEIIVNATRSTGNEYGINNYSIFGNSWFGGYYTSGSHSYVDVGGAAYNPFLNYVVHTHTSDSYPGLSPEDLSLGVRIMAVQLGPNGSVANRFCYTP